MDTSGEIEEESPPVEEDKIFVALGKEVKESKSILSWVLKNLRGKKICILHVHKPAQMIPLMGAKFLPNTLKEEEVTAYRELEKKKMHYALNECLYICVQAGVRAEKIHIESDNIEKGIVELITQHGIKKLVMGAAGDKQYSKKMTDLKSKKAIVVCEKAHVSCHIWFVCKEHLIYKREGNLEGSEMQATAPPLAGPIITSGQKHHSRLGNPVQDSFRRAITVQSGISRRIIKSSSLPEVTMVMATEPQNQLGAEVIASECEGIEISKSTYQVSEVSTSSASDMLGTVESNSTVRDEGSEEGSALFSLRQSEENFHDSSPPNELLLQEEQVEADIHYQVEQALLEAENSRCEAFDESLRHRRAEKNAVEAILEPKASESLYEKEKKQREELEVLLWKEKKELEIVKTQLDQFLEELCIAQEHRSKLESQIADSDQMIAELEEKICSSVQLLVNIKNERDELIRERDNAVREAEELRKTKEEKSATSQRPQFFSEFSFLEIERATCSFDPSMKIGEGGYGIVYRGTLRQTLVAVKMMHSHNLGNSLSGMRGKAAYICPSPDPAVAGASCAGYSDNFRGRVEFQQEMDVLSKVRHPNLISLIGACPEAWALIYEYQPNGSLEDRLACKDGTPPLSWQTRMRIAFEVCSVLIFLHSNKPHSIVHGDLKPANILLDANFVSKLGDFGISRLIRRPPENSNPSTLYHTTCPKGTFAYMDPEFLVTGELTSKSDVYAFGIIVLRLLTGRQAMGIVKEVQYELEKGNLNAVLDASAGNWPYVQAKQLAHLALQCCEMSRKNRPNLEAQVWRVLEPMGPCGRSLSFSRLASGIHCRIPSYFICPILQEIMQDPHVAADGFTYEAEALKAWFDCGHDTSPMMNVKLDHLNLVPNHACRSAIQEWLKHP